MVKKWLLTGSAMVVGVTMLVSGVFAQANSQSGYELLKEALKNKSTYENFTGNIKLNVTDNDALLIKSTGIIKADHKSKAMSGKLNFTTPGSEKSIDAYGHQNQMVVKCSDSDVYKVIEGEKEYNEDRKCQLQQSEEFNKIHEVITDALVGNIKNQVMTETNSDGSKKITLNLSENQIPDTANAILGLAIKHKSENMGNRNCEIFGDKNCFKHPELVKDVAVKSLELEVIVDADKTIKFTAARIVVSGKDKDSLQHNVNLGLDIDFSDYGTTVPDAINLDGKKVEKVEKSKFCNKMNHN